MRPIDQPWARVLMFTPGFGVDPMMSLFVYIEVEPIRGLLVTGLSMGSNVGPTSH